MHARRGSDTAAEACVAILIAGTTLDGFTTWNEKINHRCLRGPPSASQQQVPPGAQQSEAFVNGLNEPSLPQAACLALGLEQHQDVALTNRPLCTQHTRTRTSAHASASYPLHPFPAHNPPTPVPLTCFHHRTTRSCATAIAQDNPSTCHHAQPCSQPSTTGYMARRLQKSQPVPGAQAFCDGMSALQAISPRPRDPARDSLPRVAQKSGRPLLLIVQCDEYVRTCVPPIARPSIRGARGWAGVGWVRQSLTFTFRTMERFSSSKNSTRTWVTVPREPVRPSTSLTLANLGRESPSLSCNRAPSQCADLTRGRTRHTHKQLPCKGGGGGHTPAAFSTCNVSPRHSAGSLLQLRQRYAIARAVPCTQKMAPRPSPRAQLQAGARGRGLPRATLRSRRPLPIPTSSSRADRGPARPQPDCSLLARCGSRCRLESAVQPRQEQRAAIQIDGLPTTGM